MLASVLVVAAVAVVGYQNYASFFRNNKGINHQIVPTNFIGASAKTVYNIYDASRPFEHIATDAKRDAPVHERKRLLVLVVGETTRAQNWGLNPSAPDTTPELKKMDDVINYPNVSSCGTATAISVPCMFSQMSRSDYNGNRASHQEGLLDVLALGTCRDHATADALRQQFNLQTQIATDQTSGDLARFLFGPNGEVIHTVNALIHGEISQIKHQIDGLVRGEPLEEGAVSISERMQILASSLDMLNLNDAATQLRQQIHAEGAWIKGDNQDSLNALMDTLMGAENAMTILDKSYTSGAVMLPLNNLMISLHQLDEARATLVSESRGTIGMAMRALLSYTENENDALHLANVPVMLESVSGAMLFLEAPRGSQILLRTAHYMQHRFTPDQAAASADELDRLADALVCIDYYLESIEINKPAGERPFSIGEGSLAVLQAA